MRFGSHHDSRLRWNDWAFVGWVVVLVGMDPGQLGAQHSTAGSPAAVSGSSSVVVIGLQDQAPAKTVTEAATEAATKKGASGPDGFPPIVKSENNIGGKRRQVLLAFVRENHPELERLVLSLNKKRPDQYTDAIRAIDKSVTRLTNIENSQSPERYQRALEDWKLSSRIELLTAQLSIEDTPKNRKRLKELIAQQFDNRTRFIESERQRIEERLKKTNEWIAAAKKDRDAEIRRRFDSAIKKAERINTVRDRNQAEGESSTSDEPKKPKALN